jgi:hypothetical protein
MWKSQQALPYGIVIVLVVQNNRKPKKASRDGLFREAFFIMDLEA